MNRNHSKFSMVVCLFIALFLFIMTIFSHMLLLLIVLLLVLVLLLARLSVLLLLLLVHLLLLLLVLLLLSVLLLLRAGWLCVILTAAMATLPSHLLIVRLMLRQNLLTHLLLAFVDVRVKFVAVLLDRELLIIIDGNEDLLRAYWFFLWVMELCYIRMLQGLLRCESFVWIKLKQILEKVKSLFRCSREHVS